MAPSHCKAHLSAIVQTDEVMNPLGLEGEGQQIKSQAQEGSALP